MPTDRLGDVSPFITSTSLPGEGQLRAILNTSCIDDVPIKWVDDEQRQQLEIVREAIEAMHQELSAEAEEKRRAACGRQQSCQGVVMPKFEIGDFVLTAPVHSSGGNTLAMKWKVPKRIVSAIDDFTVQVQDLVESFMMTTHHAFRLQMYREARRGFTDDVLANVVHVKGGQLNERPTDCRLSLATYTWGSFVKCFGMDKVDSS